MGRFAVRIRVAVAREVVPARSAVQHRTQNRGFSVSQELDGAPEGPTTRLLCCDDQQDTVHTTREHQRVGDRVAKTYVVDKQYAGSPPFAMAFPSDPDQPPYRVSTMSPYQSGPINAPHAAPGTVHEEPQAEGAPTGYEASPAKPGNEPVWDPDRGAYVRWDARHNTWLAFDEETREWRPTA